MMVVCFRNTNDNIITVGKKYSIYITMSNYGYQIEDDNGSLIWVPVSDFKSLEDMRDYKLKQLGI